METRQGSDGGSLKTTVGPLRLTGGPGLDDGEGLRDNDLLSGVHSWSVRERSRPRKRKMSVSTRDVGPWLSLLRQCTVTSPKSDLLSFTPSRHKSGSLRWVGVEGLRGQMVDEEKEGRVELLRFWTTYEG